MSLIKPPKKEVNVLVTVRMEKELFDKLKRYAEHLDCSHAHIVSAAVAHVIKRDREFEAQESLRSTSVAQVRAKAVSE